MNIAPINFNVVNSKYKVPKFKKNDYVSTTNSNNNIDTFNFEATNKISKKNISFKGVEKGFANLSKCEGLGNMMDHFSYLEKCDPSKSESIKKVKDFIIELNDKAKSKGQELCLAWEKNPKSEGLTFDNMNYAFANENDNKIFNQHNSSFYGSGNSLRTLIEDSEKLDAGEKSKNFNRVFLEKYNSYGFNIKNMVKQHILNTTKERLKKPDDICGYSFSSILNTLNLKAGYIMAVLLMS